MKHYVQVYLILLHIVLLNFTNIEFFFYKLMVVRLSIFNIHHIYCGEQLKMNIIFNHYDV